MLIMSRGIAERERMELAARRKAAITNFPMRRAHKIGKFPTPLDLPTKEGVIYKEHMKRLRILLSYMDDDLSESFQGNEEVTSVFRRYARKSSSILYEVVEPTLIRKSKTIDGEKCMVIVGVDPTRLKTSSIESSYEKIKQLGERIRYARQFINDNEDSSLLDLDILRNKISEHKKEISYLAKEYLVHYLANRINLES